MGSLWVFYGYFVGVLWVVYGCSIVFYRYFIGILLEFYWKFMGLWSRVMSWDTVTNNLILGASD